MQNNCGTGMPKKCGNEPSLTINCTRYNDVLEKIRNFSVAVLVSAFSTPFVLAADENSGVREIGDSVYSFTLGEGNHSMFVIGEDSVAVFETFHWDGFDDFHHSGTECRLYRRLGHTEPGYVLGGARL